MLVPLDVFQRTLQCLVVKNRWGCERVENIGLWVKIAQISKSTRLWVFCSPQGPFKLSKERVFHHIDSNPLLDVRSFLGLLNQDKIELMKAALLYLEAPDDRPVESILSPLSPFATNFQGQSLLDIAIEKMLAGKNVKGILNFFFNQLAPADFFRSLKCMKRDFTAAHLIRLIELFFDGKELAISSEALQIIYVSLSCCINGELFIEWAIKKGIKFDLEILSLSCTKRPKREVRHFDHMMKILEFQPQILSQTNAQGENLIRLLLTGGKNVTFLHDYLTAIIEKYPSVLKAEALEGRSLIYYFLKNDDQFLSDLNSEYETSELYWELREDVFEVVLNFNKRWSRDFPQIYQLETTWNRIMGKFTNQGNYENWLTAPYDKDQKSFIHELVIWSHHFAGRLLKKVQSENQEIIDHLQSIAIIQGNDYDAIKTQWIKYPGLKDFMFGDLFDQYFNPKNKTQSLSKLESLFGSDWIHYRYENGDTALHDLFSVPCFDMKIEVVEVFTYMLDRGFDPDVRNHAGKSLLDLMEENQWNAYISLFQ